MTYLLFLLLRITFGFINKKYIYNIVNKNNKLGIIK